MIDSHSLKSIYRLSNDFHIVNIVPLVHTLCYIYKCLFLVVAMTPLLVLAALAGEALALDFTVVVAGEAFAFAGFFFIFDFDGEALAGCDSGAPHVTIRWEIHEFDV